MLECISASWKDSSAWPSQRWYKGRRHGLRSHVVQHQLIEPRFSNQHTCGEGQYNQLLLAMCIKYYIEFWTPTDIKDSSLEARASQMQLSERDNPLASISRVEYFECRADPRQVQYLRQPICREVTLGGRQRNVRPYCAGDDHCEVRINYFAKGFDNALQNMHHALRSVRDPQARLAISQWQEEAEGWLNEWRAVREQHLYCPQEKMRDPMICALINCGAMDRPVELWPDRRLGQDPRYVRIQ